MKKYRVSHLARAKANGEKITALTSYDALTAGIFDNADGVELDYLVMVDPDDFTPTQSRPALALGAMRVGPVRPIDNISVS